MKKVSVIRIFSFLLITTSMLSSCLSLFGIKELDLSTIDPHVQIGGFSFYVDRRSDEFKTLCKTYGDGKSISTNLFGAYLIIWADKNISDIARRAEEEKGIFLDVARFKKELQESTHANITITDFPNDYNTGIIWKANPQDNPLATVTVGLGGMMGNRRSVTIIKTEQDQPYAAMFDL